MNEIIDEISTYSDGTNIVLKIRNTGGRPDLNGVFTDYGVLGTIKVAYIKDGHDISFHRSLGRSYMWESRKLSNHNWI